MIVVSDTSPLNYLILINLVDVLAKLFQEVYIPPSVVVELTDPDAPEVVRAWIQSPPSWLKIKAPSARLASTFVLDSGEADALSLAKELHITDILIDEWHGRNVAQQEGFTLIPTLAVLERAAIQNLLDLRIAIARLQQTNIRITPDQIQAALNRDYARRHRN